jgi:outer membrane biosynthesis protein TonB
MSKRVDTSHLDAGFIIGQTDRSNREAKPNPAPPPEPQVAPEKTVQPSPEPERETVPVVTAVEPVREPEAPKEETRRRKNKTQEYETLFFKEAAVKTRSGKVVYIRKEYHDRILKIVRVIGENEFSLFNYLDNILENHFNTYQDEITELYRKKNTDVF